MKSSFVLVSILLTLIDLIYLKVWFGANFETIHGISAFTHLAFTALYIVLVAAGVKTIVNGQISDDRKILNLLWLYIAMIDLYQISKFVEVMWWLFVVPGFCIQVAAVYIMP